jgi:hypothetical protein
MNILVIVLSLISAYVLFVSVSYILARLLFPKIEVNESDERPRVLRAKQRRMSRVAK